MVDLSIGMLVYQRVVSCHMILIVIYIYICILCFWIPQMESCEFDFDEISAVFLFGGGHEPCRLVPSGERICWSAIHSLHAHFTRLNIISRNIKCNSFSASVKAQASMWPQLLQTLRSLVNPILNTNLTWGQYWVAVPLIGDALGRSHMMIIRFSTSYTLHQTVLPYWNIPGKRPFRWKLPAHLTGCSSTDGIGHCRWQWPNWQRIRTYN